MCFMIKEKKINPRNEEETRRLEELVRNKKMYSKNFKFPCLN